jgi:hypothetical protein
MKIMQHLTDYICKARIIKNTEAIPFLQTLQETSDSCQQHEALLQAINFAVTPTIETAQTSLISSHTQTKLLC